jgi:predicted dinucleotide-binding enzyme
MIKGGPYTIAFQSARAALGSGLANRWLAAEATIATIKDVVQGKIVVDSRVSFVPPKLSTVQLNRRYKVPGTGARIIGLQSAG